MANNIKKSMPVLFEAVPKDNVFTKSKLSTGINSYIVPWCERIANGILAMSIISIAAILFTQQFWGFFCDRFFSASSTEVSNIID